MSIIFQAKARRSGNSLVITIPYEVARGLGLVDGSTVNVTIEVQGDE